MPYWGSLPEAALPVAGDWLGALSGVGLLVVGWVGWLSGHIAHGVAEVLGGGELCTLTCTASGWGRVGALFFAVLLATGGGLGGYLEVQCWQ